MLIEKFSVFDIVYGLTDEMSRQKFPNMVYHSSFLYVQNDSGGYWLKVFLLS